MASWQGDLFRPMCGQSVAVQGETVMRSPAVPSAAC